MLENPETSLPSTFPPPPPPPVKPRSTWKKVTIGCSIALVVILCCAALGIVVYLERDKIPALNSLFAGTSSNANGDLIAFTSYRNGKGDIYVINVDGTGETRLTTDSANDSDAEWSPDGRKIAFLGEEGIYILDTTIVFGRDIYQNLCP